MCCKEIKNGGIDAKVKCIRKSYHKPREQNNRNNLAFEM